MTMGKELDLLLSQYSREAREMVLCLRTTILDILQGAQETIDPRAKLITYRLRNNLGAGWICAVAPRMKHVDLLFSRGAELLDPAGLLLGTGKETRHVRIKSEDATQNPALHVLIKEALQLDSSS